MAKTSLRLFLIIVLLFAAGKMHFDPDIIGLLPEPKQISAPVFPDAGINPALIEAFSFRFSFFSGLMTNKLVTVIDFSLPSTEKRLWTFDPANGQLLFNSLVAHGQGSGENIAENFSNIPQSYQSSLGFFLTAQPYNGKHGTSLRLLGLEAGINDKATERAIVVHGADYVSERFIAQYGRLGRSHGCPALPQEFVDSFISATANGSLLFIYHPAYIRQLAENGEETNLIPTRL
ncbi:MAG TPA: murein L,D-transpeptidase catalytic domain family protein [Bacteroidales bacterium]|nr:murein L,D-transpeptidase catalytic domain family protein [Bacteroidales bacterium]